MNIEERIKKLKELTDIQCSAGNWNCNSYMHGMANGMIFATAILEDEEPKYLSAPQYPEIFLDDLDLSSSTALLASEEVALKSDVEYLVAELIDWGKDAEWIIKTLRDRGYDTAGGILESNLESTRKALDKFTKPTE